jgi:hypothetical protein
LGQLSLAEFCQWPVLSIIGSIGVLEKLGPLLVIAGFPRTGTTSLYHNLSLHPAFSTAVRKELNFFFGSHCESIAHYRRFFLHARPGQIWVDASPFYSFDLRTPARIKAGVPGTKVVLVLRQPANWILSVYLQTQSLTAQKCTIAEFLVAPTINVPFGDGRFRISDGLFRNAVERFAAEFSDDLLLVDFSAFERNPIDVLKAIEDFAGVSRFFTADSSNTRPFNSSRLALQTPNWFRAFISHDLVTGIISHIFPQDLIKRVRRAVDGIGGRLPVESMTGVFSMSEFEMARNLMPHDTCLMDALFQKSQICRGGEALIRLACLHPASGIVVS